MIHLMALAAAFVIVFISLGVTAAVGLVPWLPTIVAAVLSGAVAAAFARLAGGSGLKWGLLVSSVSWLFLLVTFLSLLSDSSFNSWPLVDALLVAVVACVGGVLGSRGTVRQ